MNLDVRWRCPVTWCFLFRPASSMFLRTIQTPPSFASASKTFRISKTFCRTSSWLMCKFNFSDYLENFPIILPFSSEKLQSTNLGATLEFNMPALTLLLRRQSEQNPTASYFNVDILKYTVKSKPGAQSCPFQLVSYWKCEPSHTDLKIDYKYNNHSMASPSPVLNVSISVPVDGGVKNVQSKPHSAW